jgi:hypothetical protein
VQTYFLTDRRVFETTEMNYVKKMFFGRIYEDFLGYSVSQNVCNSFHNSVVHKGVYEHNFCIPVV